MTLARFEVVEGGRAGAPRNRQNGRPFLMLDEDLSTAPISCIAFRVYARLVRYESLQRSGSCWPGQETLAADCRVSKRAVQRALDELDTFGLIKVIPGRPNRYVLLRLLEGYSKVTESHTKGDSQSSKRRKSSAGKVSESHLEGDSESSESYMQINQTDSSTQINAAAVPSLLVKNFDPWSGELSEQKTEFYPQSTHPDSTYPPCLPFQVQVAPSSPSQSGGQSGAIASPQNSIQQALLEVGVPEGKAVNLAAVVTGRGRGLDYVWSVIRASRESGRRIVNPVGFVMAMLRDNAEVSPLDYEQVGLRESKWRRVSTSLPPASGATSRGESEEVDPAPVVAGLKLDFARLGRFEQANPLIWELEAYKAWKEGRLE